MYDNGKNLRMNNLEDSFAQTAKSLIQKHGWQVSIEERVADGEYLIVKLVKNSVIKHIAILYTQSVDRNIYKTLEEKIDAFLISSLQLDKDNYFSKGISTPLVLLSDIIELLKDWNMEAAEHQNNQIPDNETFYNDANILLENLYLSSENPADQIWMMLKMLKSSNICEKIIKKRSVFEKKELSDTEIAIKAQGVSFLIQNACDYFEAASTTNITQRILNLYYGTLSFIEAEILSLPNGYSCLEDVESITQQGHGLYTMNNSNNSLEDFYTGIIGEGRGLFSKWLDQRGKDITKLPKKKSKTSPDEFCFSFNQLLNCIPELSPLMKMIDKSYKPGFLSPVYSHELNRNYSFSSDDKYKSVNNGTYVIFYDFTKCSNLNTAKSISGRVFQHEDYIDDDGFRGYKVFIQHDKDKHWFEDINIHKSPFCNNTILVPLYDDIDDWEVFVVMILYTFSIIVRYRPNLWRRIQSGEWDQYSAVIQQLALISERILPQIFFEKISGQKLFVKQPGSF